MRHVVLVAVAVAALSCGKADKKQCETACRNYVSLSFWAKWDPLIKAEPVAEQDKLRETKLSELEYIIERGIDQCVQNCQYSNNSSQYPCMVKAKTWPEAQACAGTEADNQ
jgi:hypothetical protein